MIDQEALRAREIGRSKGCESERLADQEVVSERYRRGLWSVIVREQEGKPERVVGVMVWVWQRKQRPFGAGRRGERQEREMG